MYLIFSGKSIPTFEYNHLELYYLVYISCLHSFDSNNFSHAAPNNILGHCTVYEGLQIFRC